MRRRIGRGTRFLAGAVAALLLLGGCENSLGPDSSEVGTYTLRTVNGHTLPAPFFSVEVLSASVELHQDGSFRTRNTIRGKDSLGEIVVQNDSDSGTYVRTGNTVTLTSTIGHVTVATYAGPTLTVDEQSVEMIYRRQ
jgi:hypothetical protein